MKTFNLTLLITLSSCTIAFAGECYDRGKDNGKGTNKFVSQACLEKAQASAHFNQKRWSENKDWMIVGYSNTLMVRRIKPRIETVIAGSSTGLTNISATAISAQFNEAYAFDASTNTLSVFDVNLSGNIAPIRKYTIDELKGLVSLTVNSENGLIFAALSDKILVFERNTNQKNPMSKLAEISKPNIDFKSISTISYDSKAKRLLVTDYGTKKIYSIQTGSKGQYLSHTN